MKYFLYIPGMPVDGDTIKSGKSLGGSETAGFYVASELKRRGNDVVCFSNIEKERLIDGIIWSPIGQQSKEYPFGYNFEAHASQVPHDVLIAQRAAGIFGKIWQSKLNYFWTHDLALKRFIPPINNMLWNTDRIFGVSSWHVEQIKLVYGIDDGYISVLPNAIDSRMFYPASVEEKLKNGTMIYSSRPERGLENLVKEGGIMDQLRDENLRLLVCGYDNTTDQMRGYYNMLYDRCEKLPNVKLIGNLSKQQLANTMSKCFLHVYPTEFEETSCITAMEAQAAGNPIMTTETGALGETLEAGGVIWCEPGDMVERFVKNIKNLRKDVKAYESLQKASLKKGKTYKWGVSVNTLENYVDKDFTKLTMNKRALIKHFQRNSDHKAAQMAAKTCDLDLGIDAPNTLDQRTESTIEFYNKIANYNIDNGDKHMLGDDNILRLARLNPILKVLEELPEGAKILDYGCCVGQMTSPLAKKYPKLEFVGVDISADQIKIAKEHVCKHEIKNVKYYTAYEPLDSFEAGFDLVLCLDVLEHVSDHLSFMIKLTDCVTPQGQIMFSTPSGPIESQRGDDKHPVEHLHHFEEADIQEMMKLKKEKTIKYVSGGKTGRGESIGSYVWGWKNSAKDGPLCPINYDRKFLVQKPRQTVSCCMITRDTTDSIVKTIRSVSSFVDEFIIGVDGQNIRRVIESASEFDKVSILPVTSPLETGFAAARNRTLELAKFDWVLWIDDDEVWRYPERIHKFLRNNQFSSYAISQHHFSAEPAGLMKTDLPFRLFRNNKGIKFHGIVHEHPETAVNEGAGKSFMMPPNQSCICHNGYDTEDIRRKRFERNFPLMERDRKENPERILGKHLWIRDLAHMNRFEFEKTRKVSDVMMGRSHEIIKLWRDFIKDNVNSRMVCESIPYMSEASNMLLQNSSYVFSFVLDVSKDSLTDKQTSIQGKKEIHGSVPDKSDFIDLVKLITNQTLEPFEKNNKYM